jgi:replicative DNA helicase
MLKSKEEFKQELATEINLANYDGTDKIITSQNASEIYEEQIKQQGRGLHCGLTTLDEKVQGFRPGTLTVISGHTGQGKSLLACSLTNSFELIGKKSLWFSLEMGFGILPRFRILPEFYLPKEINQASVQWIRSRIHEAVIKFKIDAVFIDHLGYLETAEHTAHRGNSLLIGDLVRYLCRVAKEFNVAVFLLCHTKDTLENRERPGSEDIRDSGLIRREADNILMIWRLLQEGTDPKDKVYSNYSMISLDKHRAAGHTCKVRVKWDNAMSCFREE